MMFNHVISPAPKRKSFRSAPALLYQKHISGHSPRGRIPIHTREYQDGKMKGTVTSNIPRFLLPRGIQSRTIQYFNRRNFSNTTWRQAKEEKPRVLPQPDKFRPPSHPARRVIQTRNGNKVVREPFNYPGRPLTAKEKEEQKTKRYPNMFPAEGTVLFKFLTSRWIHVWIAMVFPPIECVCLEKSKKED